MSLYCNVCIRALEMGTGILKKRDTVISIGDGVF